MKIRHLLTAAALLIGSSGAAFAQSAESFDLELNAAADTSGGDCRLTYVALNNSENILERAAFEVVVFNSDGVVTRLSVLDFGELSANDTKVVRFVLNGTACADLSRIIVNDVTACTIAGTSDTAEVCRTGLNASSRSEISFGQ